MLKRLLPFITLFSPLSTLVCCALPALLVTLGLGATLVSFLGAFPQLIWLSEHKTLVFIFAGIMLSITGFTRWYYKDLSCPVEAGLARACARTKRVSAITFYAALTLYATGFFFAYIAPLINF